MRRHQLAHQPGVAFGPGENRIRRLGLVARRVEAVAAGEVVDAGPGRDGGQARAVVVAAGVVQVGQQALVAKALAGQPGGEGLGVQCCVAGCPCHSVARHGEAQGALQVAHALAEGPVLSQRGRPPLGRRQQPVLPGTRHEEALLRAVAQVPLVRHRAAEFVAQQADLVQPLAHPPGLRAGQRQVMCAQGARPPAQDMAAAVATGLVLQLQQLHVAVAGTHQGAQCGQPGDAAPQHQRASAPPHRRRRQRAGFAPQPVAAFGAGADPAAGEGGRLVAPAGREAGRAGGEQGAPPHSWTRPHSASKVCTSA